jgi:prophage regulatory protein
MADTFLRAEEVTRVTGIPRATRYELIARGEFPKPIKLSQRMVAWSAAEIAEWMQSRIALRDGQPRGRPRKAGPAPAESCAR